MFRRCNISLLSSVSRGSSIQPLCFLPTSNFHTIKGSPPTRETYLRRGVFSRPSCLRSPPMRNGRGDTTNIKGVRRYPLDNDTGHYQGDCVFTGGDESNMNADGLNNTIKPRYLNYNCASESLIKLHNKAFAF